MNGIVIVTGWYFFEDFYKKLSMSEIDVFVVGHGHSEILDKYKFKYSIIKNIGLECGSYDWYIKNRWDKKSPVLFVHDDTFIKNGKIFKKIFHDCRNYDIVNVSGKTSRQSKNAASPLYLSPRTIELFLKKFDGIWYDKHNRGYILGKDRQVYDKVYTKNYEHVYREKVGRKFKLTLGYLKEKYKLKRCAINYKGVDRYHRGKEKKEYVKMLKSYNNILSDNTIFGRHNNSLEEVVLKYNLERNRNYNHYSQWYDFFLSNIRRDNFNIVEVGTDNVNSLKAWKEYFYHSDIYSLTNNKDITSKKSRFSVFHGDRSDLSFVKKTCDNIKDGLDIVIDTNLYIAKNQIEQFEFIFNQLNPAGIYIIENINKFYKNKSEPNILNFLKEKIDDVNFYGRFKVYNYENIITKEKIKGFERTMMSVAFFPSICFVFKRFLK